jgi:predicted transcriptional regulator
MQRGPRTASTRATQDLRRRSLREPVEQPQTFVLSIRPTYIERILAGLKTVELRRRFPQAVRPSRILLYSTSPVQAIVGQAVLEEVSQLSLRELWMRFASAAAVSRHEFDTYFTGVESGCALRLTKICTLAKPIHLTDLTRRFEFSPPQSYCYWKEPLSALATHGRVKTST